MQLQLAEGTKFDQPHTQFLAGQKISMASEGSLLAGEFPPDATARLEKEFPNLALDHPNRTIYLDATGSAVYARSTLDAVFADLVSNTYSNPHSCPKTRQKVDAARKATLRHFNAPEEDYAVVFTSGATAALKLVAESFAWRHDSSSFIYSDQSHTSVMGMRELCSPVPSAAFSGQEELERVIGRCSGSGPNLVVYPAMSNFCGRKFPLEWIDLVKSASATNFVMLDAASFVSCDRLDLSTHKADFVCISFYKMFGYPTGLGALLVRHEAQPMLRGKRYFGGGTVDLNLVRKSRHVFKESEEWLEDGTSSFLDIATLVHGYNFIESVPRGIDAIGDHSFAIARYLYTALRNLRHDGGRNVVEVYCDGSFASRRYQGPIVNFNLLKPSGAYFGFAAFRRLAEGQTMAVRTGCFCNVGACQKYLQFTDENSEQNFEAGHVCGDDVDLVNGRPTGSIRVSFGVHSKREDADAVIALIRRHFVNAVDSNSDTSTTAAGARIGQIFLYPVKSCAPVAATSWKMGKTGLEWDRQWAVMKGRKALTQKNVRALCLIRPQLDLERETLTLTYPEMPPLTLPIAPPESTTTSQDFCLGRVCGDQMTTVDCGEEAARWLEEASREDGLRLVRMKERRPRRKGDQPLSLANSGQVLVLDKRSGVALADQVGADPAWTLNQFRGNLVIDGCPEDVANYSELIVGGRVHLKKSEDCTRCGMIRIDQRDGADNDLLYSEMASKPENKFSFGGLYRVEEKDCNETPPQYLAVGDRVQLIP